MTPTDPYEQWTRARGPSNVDVGFAEQVMQAVRRLPCPQGPAAVGPWTLAGALAAGGILAAARAACLLVALLLPSN